MAEAFARIHGAGKVEAFSAGSHPSGRINPRAVEFGRSGARSRRRSRSYWPPSKSYQKGLDNNSNTM
jgi:hypothetical protein